MTLNTYDDEDADRPVLYGRRLPKDPPLCLGGQGRSSRDVADGGMALVAYTVIALAFAAALGVFYLVTR